MRAVIYDHSSWETVWNKIQEDYPKSIVIPSVKKRKLGFTVRDHRYWDKEKDRYIMEIHLDFYEEKMKTLYLLKYGHYEKFEPSKKHK